MSFASDLKARTLDNLIGPAFIIFLSANIANVANLAFNMIFARVLSPAQFADLTLLLTLKLGLLSLFSAVQFGISDLVARERDRFKSKSFTALLGRKSFRYSLPLCLLIIVSAEFLGALLNFKDVAALIFGSFQNGRLLSSRMDSSSGRLLAIMEGGFRVIRNYSRPCSFNLHRPCLLNGL